MLSANAHSEPLQKQQQHENCPGMLKSNINNRLSKRLVKQLQAFNELRRLRFGAVSKRHTDADNSKDNYLHFLYNGKNSTESFHEVEVSARDELIYGLQKKLVKLHHELKEQSQSFTHSQDDVSVSESEAQELENLREQLDQLRMENHRVSKEYEDHEVVNKKTIGHLKSENEALRHSLREVMARFSKTEENKDQQDNAMETLLENLKKECTRANDLSEQNEALKRKQVALIAEVEKLRHKAETNSTPTVENNPTNKTIAEYERQLFVLNNLVNRYEASLAQNTMDLSDLKTEKDGLEEANLELLRELEMCRKNEMELKAGAESMAHQFQHEMVHLSNILESKTNELEEIKREKEAILSSAYEQTRLVESLKEDSARLKDKLSTVQSTATTSNADVSSFQVEYQQLCSKMETMQAEYEDRLREINITNEMFVKELEAMNDMELELEQLKEEKTLLEDQLIDMHGQVQALEKEKEDLTSQWEQRENDFMKTDSILQSQIQGLLSEREQLIGSQRNNESRLQSLETELGHTRKEIAEKTALLVKTQEETSQLIEAQTRLNEELTHARQSSSSGSNELNQVRKELDVVDSRYKTLLGRYEQLKYDDRGKTTMLELQKKELENLKTLKTRMEELEEANSRYRSYIETYQREVYTLKQQVSDAEYNLSTRTSEYQQIHLDKEGLKNRNEELEKWLSELEREKTMLTNKLSALETQVDSTQNNLASQKDWQDELTSQLDWYKRKNEGMKRGIKLTLDILKQDTKLLDRFESLQILCNRLENELEERERVADNGTEETARRRLSYLG